MNLKRLTDKMSLLVIRAKDAVKNKIQSMKMQSKAVLSNNRAEGSVDTGVKILISVVIGAAVLAGLYLLFADTIFFSSRYSHDRDCYA